MDYPLTTQIALVVKDAKTSTPREEEMSVCSTDAPAWLGRQTSLCPILDVYYDKVEILHQ